MQHARNPTVASCLEQMLASFSSSRLVMFLYYFGVLLGLVVLYGRGDFTTAGFIYQGF